MPEIKEFNILKKNLKRDFSGLVPIRVALLGDTATQFLVQAIRATGFDIGFDLQIWEAEFNQIENQLFNSQSDFYLQQPNVVILFRSTHKLLERYNKAKPDKQHDLADEELNHIQTLLEHIKTQISAPVVIFNYNEINDGVFGNYALKVTSSFLFQLRKLNYGLMELASKDQQLHIADISTLQNYYSKKEMFSTTLYVNTEMVLSLSALPAVAAMLVDIISALSGKFKKCVILDLDNTLWGGVIGDDGLENIQLGSLGIGKAFTEFQYWLKKLKNRGIILAVCSKNDETVAREVFEKHIDMVLKLDDIAVFVANWGNKVDNIHHIRQTLNIGFDSMVFLDDNPFERNIVKENIPELIVPALPEDPAEYLEFLYSLNLFEIASISEEDLERSERYQIEAKRTEIQRLFTSEEAFLENLQMKSDVEPFTRFNLPRAAQLSQRSNQFNLRTVRYTEAELSTMIDHSEIFPLTFTLEDKFGNNGLICLIILKKTDTDTLFIDTWLMSCRVLKRGMENFTLNTIVDFCLSQNISQLIGEYIPSAKNKMVQDHYLNLGFHYQNGNWCLNLKDFKAKTSYITKK